jgi:DNA-directed RNA polymerase subunit alpha
MAVTRIPLPDWARSQKADDRLDMPLAETELSVRTVNCLEDQAIFSVRDLLNCTPERLLEIPNFGEKTLQTVYDALEKVGFSRPSVQRGGELPPLETSQKDRREATREPANGDPHQCLPASEETDCTAKPVAQS